MLAQLLIIGYFLAFIFDVGNGGAVVLILAMMVLVSSWIALHTVKTERLGLFKFAALSILVGGGSTLAVMTQAVIGLEPWYLPQFMIPLAGMVFSSSMNSVSLAAERFCSESESGVEYVVARNTAFRASLIPITNSLFAVGLVSIPGMMTGQIPSTVVRRVDLLGCPHADTGAFADGHSRLVFL